MHLTHLFRYPVGALLLPTLTVLFIQGSAFAQEKSVARCSLVEGALLLKDKQGTAWQSISAKQTIPADRLLVALFGADLQSANDAVGIKLLGDNGLRGVFPVLEAAVLFRENSAVDAELTLDRGVVIFSNRKKTGAVKIRVHVLKETFDITLPNGKAKLGVEIYGRHVPGPPKLDPKMDVPVTHLFFVALAGEPTVENEHKVVRLHEPPGTALLLWDSITNTVEARHFDELPEAAKPFNPEEQRRFNQLCAYARRLTEKPLDTQIDLLLKGSPDADQGRVGVTAAGALDQLPQLIQGLESRQAETRDHAVLAIRHWLGRTSGQSIRLYEHLTRDRNYNPIQAKTVLHLLNGILQEKLKQPSTYDVLIQALDHSKLPVRELARWHLVRLVPDGKAIAYDAGADPAQRQRMIEAWRRLIPEGELPPLPKKK